MGTSLRQRLDSLEENSELLLGRLNGLASLLIIISRHLPPEVAKRCADDARGALPYIDAKLVATPHSDVMGTEMQRVILEGLRMLDSAAGTPMSR